MEQRIMELLESEELLEKDAIGDPNIIDNEFETLGLSSIAYIKLLVLLETEFDMEFPDDYLQLYVFKSIREIINYIEASSGELQAE